MESLNTLSLDTLVDVGIHARLADAAIAARNNRMSVFGMVSGFAAQNVLYHIVVKWTRENPETKGSHQRHRGSLLERQYKMGPKFGVSMDEKRR